MLAFCGGIAAATRLPQLPSQSVVAACALSAVLLLYWRSLRWGAAFLLGACWLCYNAELRLQQRWPEPPFARDAWVEATVWSLPEQRGDSQRLRVRLEKVCYQATLTACDFTQLPTDQRFALLTVYQPLHLTVGARWRWLVRLRPPHGMVNPAGFDYEAWLLQQGLNAVGYVREDPANQALTTEPAVRTVERWRQQLAQQLSGPAVASLHWPQLLRALTLGDDSGISAQQWDLFAQTGTTHLLVISGSHVALIALLVYALVYWGCGWLPHLLARWPASIPAAAIAFLTAWFYAALAGFALPTQRAAVMLGLFLLAQAWRRQLNSWYGLSLALFLLLLVEPLALLNVGFWLSFIAVAVLLHAAALVQPSPHWWLRLWQQLKLLFVLQLQLTVALLPVLLSQFQQTSVLAPFINLPLIPLIGWAVVPLALLGLLLLPLWQAGGLLLLHIADVLLDFTMHFLHFSNTLLPESMLQLPSLTTPSFVMLVLAVAASLLRTVRWQRWLALASLPLILWLGRLPPLPPDTLRLRVLDVGQGLAVSLSFGEQHMLYDTGPLFSDSFDAGADVVLPVLWHDNVQQLHTLMVSHSDQDHAGGLAALLPHYPQALLSTSKPGLFPASAKQTLCRAGQQWQWGQVQFSVLHPDELSYHDNNSSCVLLVEYAGTRILLTGDIEKEAEAALLQRYPQLRAQVVVAPHHGSNSSSSPAFIRQLQPQVVIYSHGYQNRYGHPAPAVQQRYKLTGAEAYSTASDGALTMTLGAEGQLSITAERQSTPHFWRSD